MKELLNPLFIPLVVCGMACLWAACSDENNEVTPPENDDVTVEETVQVQAVSNLKAEQTLHANELLVSWTNPSGAAWARLSWWPEDGDASSAQSTSVQVSGGARSSHTITVSEYGSWCIGVEAMDNYGNRSVQTVVTATPAADDFPKWQSIADSCTYVLIEQFMNKSTGTFWSTPADVSGSSYNIYWQQAHAMDVVVYSYERIKDDRPELASTYEAYFRLWYDNDANNYHNDPDDPTGFLNPYTDDMCWICLTLIHLTEATGNQLYLETARQVYDDYIITRALTDDNGTGLPWTSTSTDRNACTNTPGCLVAAKLYQHYGRQSYLDDALTLHAYIMNNLKEDDGRVEEPPLSYTQGTFGEACRQLFHIMGDASYLRTAEEVIQYAFTSGRCTSNGILRDEGSGMDQSIFKAVLIPYAVNLLMDESASWSVRSSLRGLLEDNAEALYLHLERRVWPAMYCSYYWGETFATSQTASMGAQTSGASLMEGMARIERWEAAE